jgi:hypothetical protein
MLRNILYCLNKMQENKHYAMLILIRHLLLDRAQAGLHTTLQKVISHIGIPGNECADSGAADALSSPDRCDYDLTSVPGDHFTSLPAWPCFLAQRMPPLPPLRTFMNNLTTAIKQSIHTLCPHLTDGTCKATATYTRQQTMNTLCNSDVSNSMWSSSPYWIIKNIVNIRAGLVWTSARAKLCHIPYRTKAGSRTDGHCPICLPHSTPSPVPDTVGHVLGSCSHPDMKALYITRHNQALHIIQRSVLHGPKGGSFLIMDATSSSALPYGVSFNRIPKCFLPSISDDLRLQFRPDIMMVEGLMTTDSRAPTSLFHVWSRQNKAAIQSDCTIHILELGYCSDASHTSCVTRKLAQHQQLLQALRDSGWKVSYHVVVITSSGQIFRTVEPSVRALGVPGTHVLPLLRKLHLHSVRSASDLIRLRRRLENNPLHFHSDPFAEDTPHPP